MNVCHISPRGYAIRNPIALSPAVQLAIKSVVIEYALKLLREVSLNGDIGREVLQGDCSANLRIGILDVKRWSI